MARDTWHRLLWLAALAALGTSLFFFAFRSIQAVGFPHELEYGEGPVLSWSRQVADGTLPFKPIAPFPWNFSVYSPGYLLASAPFLHLLPTAPWFGGRAISLLSALALAGLLVLAVTGRSRSGRAAAWLAAALWLASPYLFRWATFYRPDLFALLWSAAGILLVERAFTTRRQSLLVPAALFFVLSFWSKQSFVAAPIAALLFLALRERRWLPGFVLVGSVGSAVVGIALWLASGGALLANLVAANANAYSVEALLYFQQSFLMMVPVLLLLALPQITRGTKALNSPLPLYGITSVFVSFSVGKVGAWENYFLEPLWVMIALAGRTLAEWLRELGWKRVLVPGLVLAQLAFFVPGFERLSLDGEQKWFTELRTESRALREVIGALPEDALIWSEQMGVLAEIGRPVPLHSFIYTQLARQNLWAQEELVVLLREGTAPLLVQRHDAIADPLDRERWSREMLDASERGYALGASAGQWLLRPPLPFPSADRPQQAEGDVVLLNLMAVTGRCEEGDQVGCSYLPVAPVALEPGANLQVHLLWQNHNQIQVPLSSSIQLFGPDGSRVAQEDTPLRGGSLDSAWPEGAIVRDEHTLQVPEHLEAGAYTLRVVLYERESGTVRGAGNISNFKVPVPPPADTLSVPSEATFGETMRLLTHDAPPAEVSRSENIVIRTQWSLVGARPPEGLTTFLHLLAPDGSLAAQVDFTPQYPPSLWSPGERVELVYNLTLPPDLPPGVYQLRLGWYLAETGERLAIRGDESVDDALFLGEVGIR